MTANLSISTWIYLLNKTLRKAVESDDSLEALRTEKLLPLVESYVKTHSIQTAEGVKTNSPASAFINDACTTKLFHINLRMLDAASGILVLYSPIHLMTMRYVS